MAKKTESSLSLDFSKSEVIWPSQEQFPVNRRDSNITIEKIITEDVKNSSNYLIVTGFTSIAYLTIFFGERVNTDHLDSIRVILGWSPEERQFGKDSIINVEIEKEIREHWIKQGFSILEHCESVFKLIDLIQKHKITFKVLNAKRNHLHAKIYVGEHHAILGSANFSKKGLTTQIEACTRVGNNYENAHELSQYNGFKQIAENFYNSGDNFNKGIIDLLEKTLKITTWEEALARAITEILDRNWKNDFPELKDKIEQAKLWPMQEKVIGWAFSILQEQGSVLIATSTGSGKTKLITILQLLLIKWLSDIVGIHKTISTTICPPLIKDKWDKEATGIISSNSPISIHALSYDQRDSFEKNINKIKTSNILVVDEAHNFLNFGTNRYQNFSKHGAENVILSTATPIAKRTTDLLSLIDLLGLDNLDEDLLKDYKLLVTKGNKFKGDEFIKLKKFINHFLVRLTKSEINKLIDENSEGYKNEFGQKCRYPNKDYLTFDTLENENDQILAKQIQELSKELKGIIYLTDFKKPIDGLNIPEEKFVKTRIKMANSLASYNVIASLRSSKPALIERIYGTDYATKEFKFKTIKKNTGDFLSKIQNIINKKELPKIGFPKKYFEEWLIDIDKYIAVCQQEIEIYTQIASLCLKISNKREESKVNFLLKLFEKHQLIIAFDNTVITLDYFKSIIDSKHSQIDVHVGTGNTDKSFIQKYFS